MLFHPCEEGSDGKLFLKLFFLVLIEMLGWTIIYLFCGLLFCMTIDGFSLWLLFIDAFMLVFGVFACKFCNLFW